LSRGCGQAAGLLKVRVEDSTFVVERSLLARSCEYFRALFRSGMRESQQDELHLRGGLRPRGFLVALAAAQGERPVILDPEELLEAAECAAFLQVEALASHLADILDTDNCLLLYHAAAIFGLWGLYHSAAAFLRDSYRDLRDVAEQTLPEDMLQYVQSLSSASFVALGTHTPSMKILQDSFRNVCYLDEEEKAWRHLTDLPIDASTSMAGVAVMDNRLYVIGGVRGVSKVAVDRSFCFDPVLGEWSEFDGPQQPRYNYTLVGHEGRLYAVGGEYEKQVMSSVEAFDVSKAEWAFVKHTPRPVASPASAVCRRRMFLCFWKPPETTDIYEYEADNDDWTLATKLVRSQSYGHCMVAHRDNLYVMRNGPCDDFLRCLMDCYNITTRQWTALPGHYINSKGALFTAVVRGDSAFTVNRAVTLEFQICRERWKPRKEMTGFPKSGSLWTCLLRLPGRLKNEDRNGQENDQEAAGEGVVNDQPS
uniref:BTB domain-containing protein n=1 Tax=Denticeps clupeoides TaxID=299321 RepID=A0AAY4AWF1_9TELE